MELEDGCCRERKKEGEEMMQCIRKAEREIQSSNPSKSDPPVDHWTQVSIPAASRVQSDEQPEQNRQEMHQTTGTQCCARARARAQQQNPKTSQARKEKDIYAKENKYEAIDKYGKHKYKKRDTETKRGKEEQ